MSFYRRFYNIFEPLVSWMFRVEVVGVENIPEDGAIIAANHTSFADPIIISAAAKRQVRYMAKKELFKTPLSPLIKALGAYPVDRGGADVGSIKKTIALVEEGELVGIFPQGHRHPGEDPRQTEIKSGIGLISYHAEAKILPVFIDSGDRMKTRLFRKNRVIFGKCIPFEELCFSGGGKTEYMLASRIIFDRVCELKFGAGLPESEETPRLEEPVVKDGGADER